MAAQLPDVSYQSWLSLFILSQRLMVVVGLFETAANHMITERVSSRVGHSLDRFARVFVPLDYVVFNSIFVAVGSTGIDTGDPQKFRNEYKDLLVGLEAFAWANFVMVVVLGAAFAAASLGALYRKMYHDPMLVHRSMGVSRPLDSNEIGMIFHSLDADGNGILELQELVHTIIIRNAGGALKPFAAEIVPKVVAALSTKAAFRDVVDKEIFHINYKVLMAELSLVCVQYLDRAGLDNEGRARPEEGSWRLRSKAAALMSKSQRDLEDLIRGAAHVASGGPESGAADRGAATITTTTRAKEEYVL